MKPYHKNPRTITKKRLDRLADTLARLGDMGGIVHNLETDEIVGGNQRMRVFAEGAPSIIETLAEPDEQGTVAHGYIIWQGKKYSYRQVRWDEKTAEEANIAANVGAGAWDWDSLSSWNAGDLMQWGFDDDLFKEWKSDAGALGNLLESEKPPLLDAEPQLDRAEELQKVWQTATGQLWAIGDHRLAVGDCTDPATVERVMQGEKARMVFTDPPYNVSYQDNESIESLKKRNRRTDGLVVSNDAMTDDEFDAFLLAFLSEMPLIDGGGFYLCAPPGRTETQFRNALACVSGLTLRECIVWVKDVFVFGRQNYHWRHESILYGWKDGAAHYFVDDHTQDTVWQFDRPRTSPEHPTMKPVELVSRAIENSSLLGELVFDPFAGSGTTGIACQNLGRKARMIEISPAYCSVVLQRFADAFPGIEIERIE